MVTNIVVILRDRQRYYFDCYWIYEKEAVALGFGSVVSLNQIFSPDWVKWFQELHMSSFIAILCKLIELLYINNSALSTSVLSSSCAMLVHNKKRHFLYKKCDWKKI